MYNHIIICIYIYIYTSSVYSQSIYYVCFFDYIHVCFAGSECDQLVGKEQVYDYIVQHNDMDSALRFIMSRVPPLGSSSPCCLQVASLCSNVPHCTSHLRDNILDYLAG